jgi:hypothetical protein
VSVLQVGSRQITLSVYRQLDRIYNTDKFEAFGRIRDTNYKGEGIQLVGRNTDTGALVRHTAQHPDWSAWDGPDEFAHWLAHTKKVGPRTGPWTVAGSDRRSIRWTGRLNHNDGCTSTYHWHINEPAIPGGLAYYSTATSEHDRERFEKAKQERCRVDFADLERTWHAEAAEELTEMLKAQSEYDRFKALPLIVLAGLK